MIETLLGMPISYIGVSEFKVLDPLPALTSCQWVPWNSTVMAQVLESLLSTWKTPPEFWPSDFSLVE